MADNVAISAGTGTSIATDEIQVSGTGTIGHVQFVKLVDGTLNGTSAIASGNGTAATALRVSIASDSTGTAIGTHDSPEGTLVSYLGASATTGLSGITLVANDDATHIHAGVDGVLITRPHCGLEDIVSGRATDVSGNSFAVIAAGAAGVKHYLTTITLVNTSTTAIYADVLDGATIKMSIPVPAQGGATVNLPVPIPGTAATAWNCDASGATTTLIATYVGFKSKV